MHMQNLCRILLIVLAIIVIVVIMARRCSTTSTAGWTRTRIQFRSALCSSCRSQRSRLCLSSL